MSLRQIHGHTRAPPSALSLQPARSPANAGALLGLTHQKPRGIVRNRNLEHQV